MVLQPFHNPSGRAFRTGIAHRFQLGVDTIATDLALRFLDPTDDVVDERIGHLLPDRDGRNRHVQTGIPGFHIAAHRVVIDTTQLRC